MPATCSNWPSSSPAGPAPTIATCVLIARTRAWHAQDGRPGQGGRPGTGPLHRLSPWMILWLQRRAATPIAQWTEGSERLVLSGHSDADAAISRRALRMPPRPGPSRRQAAWQAAWRIARLRGGLQILDVRRSHRLGLRRSHFLEHARTAGSASSIAGRPSHHGSTPRRRASRQQKRSCIRLAGTTAARDVHPGVHVVDLRPAAGQRAVVARSARVHDGAAGSRPNWRAASSAGRQRERGRRSAGRRPPPRRAAEQGRARTASAPRARIAGHRLVVHGLVRRGGSRRRAAGSGWRAWESRKRAGESGDGAAKRNANSCRGWRSRPRPAANDKSAASPVSPPHAATSGVEVGRMTLRELVQQIRPPGSR